MTIDMYSVTLYPTSGKIKTLTSTNADAIIFVNLTKHVPCVVSWKRSQCAAPDQAPCF